MEKYYANKGVARNKKPLKNIVYEIELSQLKSETDVASYEKYKFKELGAIWSYFGGMKLKIQLEIGMAL